MFSPAAAATVPLSAALQTLCSATDAGGAYQLLQDRNKFSIQIVDLCTNGYALFPECYQTETRALHASSTTKGLRGSEYLHASIAALKAAKAAHSRHHVHRRPHAHGHGAKAAHGPPHHHHGHAHGVHGHSPMHVLERRAPAWADATSSASKASAKTPSWASWGSTWNSKSCAQKWTSWDFALRGFYRTFGSACQGRSWPEAQGVDRVSVGTSVGHRKLVCCTTIAAHMQIALTRRPSCNLTAAIAINHVIAQSVTTDIPYMLRERA